MRTVLPVSPGEMLEEEFLKPSGLTKYRLAKDFGVSPQRIGDIVAGKRAVTADTGTFDRAATSASVTAGGCVGRRATTPRWRGKRCRKNLHAFLAAHCLPHGSERRVRSPTPRSRGAGSAQNLCTSMLYLRSA